MTRNMDLIKIILERVEDMHIDAGGIYMLQPGSDELEVDGYSEDDIYYNFKLSIEKGLVGAPNDYQAGCGFLITGLTWEGHEFLDTIRDPEVWASVKTGMKKAGSMGIDLVVALAKAEAKRLLSERLGIHVS